MMSVEVELMFVFYGSLCCASSAFKLFLCVGADFIRFVVFQRSAFSRFSSSKSCAHSASQKSFFWKFGSKGSNSSSQ